MTSREPETYDLIGVGFGPSNLALAIAIKEANIPLRIRFLEAEPTFAWHPGMMIPGADMQISFLKDLVSQRNPQSRYTFVNYLHEQGRMNAFINRKTFFPSRVEFNDYLRWVAADFNVCDYDRRVVGIAPVKSETGPSDAVQTVEIAARDAAGNLHTYHARNLVIAPGGQCKLPALCDGFGDDTRIVHSNDYMRKVVPHLQPDARIAVIGAGQSAAEIFADLALRPEAPKLDLIFRAQAMKPSDDSPFVNEVFAADQTDQFHAMPENIREALLQDLATTNYAVVDADLINIIYTQLYEQSVDGSARLNLRARTQIASMSSKSDKIELQLDSHDGSSIQHYDTVIFATGYTREISAGVLHDITGYCETPVPDRNYRLPMKSGFNPAVFVQGYSENSHGLSDTLLSVLAQRSAEIASAITATHAVSSVLAAE